MGEGVGNAVIAVAGAGRLQCIEGHAGSAIADAVHMDAKARLVEFPNVAGEIGGAVVDQPITASILAVGGDGDLLACLIHGEVGGLVVGQHACVGQEGGRAEGIPFQYPVEEDLDRIGLDQGIAGELVAHPVRLGQMTADIEFAAVVILVKTGGGGDPHIEQPLIFHLPQAIADKVGGAGILNAGDAARGHQGRDGGQALAILARRLLVMGAEQAAVGGGDGAAGPLANDAAIEIHIGFEGGKEAARRQRGGGEADLFAALVGRLRQCPRVVGTGVAIDPGQHHRIVGRCGIEGCQYGFISGGGSVALVGGPLVDHQPIARLGGVAGQAALHLGRQLAEIDRLAVEIAHIERHRAKQVDMVVVQPRQHHLALQIDHLGVGGGERLGPLPVAHIEELVAAHHHRLCHLTLAILGVDLAVKVEGTRGGGRLRLLAARQRGGQQRREQQT